MQKVMNIEYPDINEFDLIEAIDVFLNRKQLKTLSI